MAKLYRILAEAMGNVKGATAVEYGLIIALISLAAVTAMSRYSVQLSALFDKAGKTMYNGVK